MDAEKRWLSIDGPEFIEKIGIRKGYTVVDFGCGHGHYTIPVARAVQAEGRVYALDNDGLLSVYPKHYKSDSPMWSLADMDIEDIIKEITVIGFCLQNTLYEKLFHFHSYTSGHILTLRKVGKEGP